MDRRNLRPPGSRWVLAGIGVLATAGSAFGAGSTSYNPSISFGYAVTDNVRYIGEDPEGGDGADDSWSVSVRFPVLREAQRSSLRFMYLGRYRAYGSEKALDNLEHNLDLDWNRQVLRRSGISLIVRLVRTQDQGDPASEEDLDFFIAERTQRTAGAVNASFNSRIGERWIWRAGGGVARSRFEQLSGFDPGETAPPVEDTDGYGVSLQIDRVYDRRTEFGFIYQYQWFEQETRPEETVHRFGLKWRRELARGFNFGVLAGGFVRSRDESETTTSNYEKSGVDLSLTLGYGLDVGPLRFQFSLGAAPSGGAGLIGTSTNYGVQVRVTRSEAVQSEVWRWEFAMRYAVRQPSDRDDPELSTFSTGGFVERALTRGTAARLSARYVDQSSSDPTAFAGAYQTVAASFVWYPLAGTRLGAGR